MPAACRTQTADGGDGRARPGGHRPQCTFSRCLLQAAVPWLRKQGRVIINTTSIAGRNGGSLGTVFYAAAKSYVSTFTRGSAKEIVGDRIRVNAVSPGCNRHRFPRAFLLRSSNESCDRDDPNGSRRLCGRMCRMLSVLGV